MQAVSTSQPATTTTTTWTFGMAKGPMWLLLALLIGGATLSACLGAVTLSFEDFQRLFTGKASITISHIFWNIRLPRIVLGAMVGAGLAVSGACMQGLFRNPLADPGLTGTSAGGVLSASLAIVLGINKILPESLAPYGLSLCTFFGALGCMVLVYRLSRKGGRVDVTTMLLVGIAINALAGAGTGLMTYLADDDELRSLTFWTLGSLGGSTWESVLVYLPFALIALFMLPKLIRGLNLLALGEREASYLGLDVKQLKNRVLLLTALCVGASISMTGMIGFVGLVVPHIIRKWLGADHQSVLLGSVLLGPVIIIGADLLSRTIVQPTELPIGILTSLMGTPFFLSLVKK